MNDKKNDNGTSKFSTRAFVLGNEPRLHENKTKQSKIPEIMNEDSGLDLIFSRQLNPLKFLESETLKLALTIPG